MKRITPIIMGILLLALLSSSVLASSWNSYVIRNSSGGTAPQIIDRTDLNAKEFVINQANMKAAWGTNDINGAKVGEILTASITRLDDYTRFTTGSGPAVAPYFNIWITDGNGKYAVVANEPSNAEWNYTTRWNMTWDILKTKTLKVYECTDKSWLPSNGSGLKFQDIANYKIQAPTAAELSTSWAGLTSGAPRELGTNTAYGFNWMFGDTLSNYVSGDSGYIVKNATVTAVPEPATLSVLGIGLVGFIMRRRNKA